MLLQSRNLKHRFTWRGTLIEPLRDINFTVNPGQVVVITGLSGAGKTTLLLACAGMRKPTAGTVELMDRDVYSLPPSARLSLRAEKLGFVFQTLQLIPYLTLWENLTLAPRADQSTAEHWMDRLGLSERRSHLPRAMSQGERQRAAVARALVHRPQLLLVDEPTGNLDPENSRSILDAMRQFVDEGGGVVVASHDVAVAQIASVVYRLDAGVLTELS